MPGLASLCSCGFATTGRPSILAGMTPPLDLASSRLLVTGASSGIGAEIARATARSGAELVLVARRGDRLEALAGELSSLGARAVTTVLADLGETTAFDTIVREAGDPIDILVNNAGIGDMASFTDTPPDLVGRMIDVNVTTHCRLTRHYTPGMIERRKGGVLTIASVAGLLPAPYMSLYGATKAFLVSFSSALHQELAGTGVGVSCVCPGPVKTEFFDANRMNVDDDLVAGAASAGDVAAFALEALARNQAVAVPGLGNRIRALVPSLMPRRLSGWLARRVMEKRMAAGRS